MKLNAVARAAPPLQPAATRLSNCTHAYQQFVHAQSGVGSIMQVPAVAREGGIERGVRERGEREVGRNETEFVLNVRLVKVPDVVQTPKHTGDVLHGECLVKSERRRGCWWKQQQQQQQQQQ